MSSFVLHDKGSECGGSLSKIAFALRVQMDDSSGGLGLRNLIHKAFSQCMLHTSGVN